LPLHLAELQVFNSTVASIVLAMAVGQNALLMCRAWCEPPAPVMSACHHGSSASPTVSGDGDSCDDLELQGAAFLREDLRRGSLISIAPGSAEHDSEPLQIAGHDATAGAARSLHTPRPDTPLRI
jgi:hypothetical protein